MTEQNKDIRDTTLVVYFSNLGKVYKAVQLVSKVSSTMYITKTIYTEGKQGDKIPTLKHIESFDGYQVALGMTEFYKRIRDEGLEVIFE